MLTRLRTRLGAEGGFALPTVLVLLFAGSLFAVASWGATRGDIGATGGDRNSKQALDAAESGIEYYRYHLSIDNNYWTNCDAVPGNAPVNQPNPTAPIKWSTVPGSTARYRIELVPQNGFTQCVQGNPLSMIDGPTGTLQVKAIGQAGTKTRTVTATLRHKGFLDFLYFTDLETEDPTIYLSSDPPSAAWADTNCRRYRYATPPRPAGTPPTGCRVIVFGPNDAIHGPMHTNDDIVTCGNPIFGRDPSTQGGKKDSIEISGPAPGYQAGCGGSSSPTFWGGAPATNAPTINMPSTNSQLGQVSDPAWTFTGKTYITVNGGSMTVKNAAGTDITPASGWPPNGVVYVKNATSGAPATLCAGYTYNLQQTYNAPTGCAETYVKSGATPYTKSFTVGSANDIVINGSLNRDTTKNAIAGLIADGFVRVYHPVNRSNCGTNAGGELGSVTIDAAILSVQHQFRVDNYDCGPPQGTLTINGVLAQKFRGTVGVVGSSGYNKNYNYDDRLKNISPPYFLDPLVSEWRVIRFNEQLPGRT